MDECIRIERVCAAYKTNRGFIEALRDINLSVRNNEFVSIVGPSGCGKTTLLKIIGGLVNPSNGEVRIKGKSVDEVRRNREIGFVFQNPALLPWRTVLGNVYLPLEIIGIDSISKEKADSHIMKLLELVGIADFKVNYPHELSGGMQQRVAIARALSFNPSILLMDEPFGSLDEITRDRMNLELLRIWKEVKHTIIFVTHSTREAILLADRVVVLSQRPGKIVEILDVGLPRPREAGLRYAEEFLKLAKRIHGLLNNGN